MVSEGTKGGSRRDDPSAEADSTLNGPSRTRSNTRSLGRACPAGLLALSARPAFAGFLEGEDAFCVLLGLTLAGILGGWALLYGSQVPGRVPTDAGMAVLAAPTLYLSVVIFFPAAERLMAVAPAVPLVLAAALRAYFRSHEEA
jgi:hypothetical protein